MSNIKVEKPEVVKTSYEASNKEEELEMVPVVINNNNVNVVSNSKSDSGEDDFKNDEDNFFDEDIDDQVKATPKTTISAKVVQAMKKLQASYNDNASKIIEQATKEKSAIKNSNFLINLAMVTGNTKPVPEEPKTFTEAWNHPNANFCTKWQEVIQ